jgi:hypothetical protein
MAFPNPISLFSFGKLNPGALIPTGTSQSKYEAGPGVSSKLGFLILSFPNL